MKSRFILFFAALVLVSCASPEKDWQLAERDDSRNAYLEFLAKHPDSKFAERARTRIDELRVIRSWERAEFKDTIAAYEAFIEKYADSEYASAAREKVRVIQRDERWEALSADPGTESLEEFLAAYPQAPQSAEARSLLADLAAAEEAAQPKERPGDFRLQLAAFKTVAAAETELRRLVALTPDTLIGPVRIETPDRDAGHSMFLLKSVPMSYTEARDACARLQELRQECLIIGR